MSPSPTWTAKRGFTLLEVLVALIIFALAFGVVAQIVQTAFRQTASAADATRATLYARSLLARVGHEIPITPEVYDGETEDGLRWELLVGQDRKARNSEGFLAYVVEARVAWGDAGREQAVTLTTIRLGFPQQ